MKDLILVALSSFSAQSPTPLERLIESGIPFKLHTTGKRITQEELLKEGKDATVILAGVETYSSSIIAQLPKLQCISRLGVGVDAIDLNYAKERGVLIANTPTIPIQAVAELALTMFLSLSRNIPTQINLMQRRIWDRIPTHLLFGRTIGLIGLGKIGQKVAELCNAFNTNILAYDPFVKKELAESLNIKLVEKDQLLKTSDIVSIHASKSTDQNVLIGKNDLEIMRKGSILVNLARGEMVDESALIEALTSGHIGGAGLDVFEKEPYSGPLCDFNNVILTPHSATMPIETRVAMELECLENGINFINRRKANI